MIEIPGYTIKREVGQGGMASVYLAMQLSLDREVALKVMAPALAADPAFSKRFLQEARTLASLAHPNIVAVYDVGVSPSQLHYFSMQYLPGGDFVSRVKTAMDERELVQILAGIARALGYAHQRGYVHRDVAPGNILFDAAGTPVLTDFGIALAATQGSRITSAGFSVGTSHYMSPEQARGGDVDARSDIYSLGVLTYYGLTGKPPFDGADGFAVAYAHVFEPIPHLPPERAQWQPLLDRALAKDAKDRYPDVEAFQEGLAAVAPQFAALFRDSTADPATLAFNADAARVAEQQRQADSATQVDQPFPDITEAGSGAPTVPLRPVKPPAPVKEVKVYKASTSKTPRSGMPALADRAKPTMRIWPLLVMAVGLILVGTGLYLAYRNRSASVAKPTPPPAQTIAATPIVTLPPPVAPAPAPETAPAPAPTERIAVAPVSLAPETGVAATADSPSPVVATPTPVPEDSTTNVPAVSSDATAAETTDTGEVPLDIANVPTVVDPVLDAVRLGRIDFAGQRFTTPPVTNAFDRFTLALKIDPKNKAAKQGVLDVARKYVEFADKAAAAKDLALFSQSLDRASDVAKSIAEGDELNKEIAERRRKLAAQYLAEGKNAVGAWNKGAAKAAFEKALQVDPSNTAARDALKRADQIGQPGYVFRDSQGDSQGPELVILPGSKIAAQRMLVTRAEFRRFWNASGAKQFTGKEPSCRDRESIFRSSRKRNWESPDIKQEDNHPVVCVGFEEAAAYAKWISKETGKRYRLLAPNEWAQLIRLAPAGDCKTANLADAAAKKEFDARGSDCDDGFAATAPVGRFEAVAGGVYDIDGNVRIWVGACANGSPADIGSACRDFLVKGRGWLSAAGKEPATFSDNYAADVTTNSIGFRLVRELDQ